jgi:hypothetical protein
MRYEAWLRCPECEGVVRIPGEDQISTPLFVAQCRNCGLAFDWRMSWGSDFLRGSMFVWQEYLAPGEGVWNHDHCACCLLKFLEDPAPGSEQAGYVAYFKDEIWWICQGCFEDFHEEMGWVVEPT